MLVRTAFNDIQHLSFWDRKLSVHRRTKFTGCSTGLQKSNKFEVSTSRQIWPRRPRESRLSMRFLCLRLSLLVSFSCFPMCGLAQVKAVRADSAEAIRMLLEFQNRQREEQRMFANAKVVLEEKLWLTPTEADIAKDIALRELERPQTITFLKDQIATLQKSKGATRVKTERAEIDKTLEQATATLRSLERKEPVSASALRPRLPMDKLEVGALGVLEIYSDSSGTLGREIVFVVTQVLDKRNLMAKYGDTLIWVSNVSTTGIIDGQDVRLLNVMKVTGTKTYSTVSGRSNTVFIVQPIDPGPADAAMANQLAERKAPKVEPKRPIELANKTRTWASAEGGFKVEAEFVSAASNLVKLRKMDGTTITVAIDKLSNEDKEWIEARKK